MRSENIDRNVEVLVPSSRFRGANGITWGPDNLIWMGSVWSQTIVAVDPETGEVKHEVEASKGADDLAFHPDGRLYWNDIAFGEVGCRQITGETGIVGNTGPGNNGIAISDDGRIFVSQLFLGSKLFEIDPDGKNAPREVADLGNHMSNGMAFGPDGKLYGSAYVAGEVIRIDTETGAVEIIASNVGIPDAVKFNNKGELHVQNLKAGTVSKVDINTGTLELVARLPWPSTDNFCFSPDDRLFVSSNQDGYLWEVTSTDTQRVVIAGGLGIIGGIAFSEAKGRKSLVAVDAFAIRKFNADTGEALSAVRDVTLATDVGWMLTVSKHGEHLVASSWPGNFIKIWDPETDSLIANFEQFKLPLNAVSLGHDLAYSDLSGNVRRFSPDAPDEASILAEGLKQPVGLAYANGALFASEELDGRVVQVTRNDEPIKPRVIAQGLEAPQGLALFGGDLLVVEAGAGKLLLIDLASGQKKTLAEGLNFHSGRLVFEDLGKWARAAVTVSGRTAWVSGTRDAVIYKVRL